MEGANGALGKELGIVYDPIMLTPDDVGLFIGESDAQMLCWLSHILIGVGILPVLRYSGASRATVLDIRVPPEVRFTTAEEEEWNWS